MYRASDSGSEGWGFESLPVYQIKEEIPKGISSFISCFAREGTRKGGTSAHTGVKTCRWHVFSPWESPWMWERNSQNCETISIKRCEGDTRMGISSFISPSGVPNNTNPNFLPVGEGFGFAFSAQWRTENDIYRNVLLSFGWAVLYN